MKRKEQLLRIRPYLRCLRSALLIFSAMLPLTFSGLVFASPAPQQTAKSYLVSLRPGASARALIAAGFTVRQEWTAFSAAQTLVDAKQLVRLQAHPAVEFVEEDRPVYAFDHAIQFQDRGGYTWGVQAVHAPQSWSTTTGAGIKVCVLDTGIDVTHPEFVRQGVSIIKGSKNFTSQDTADVQDRQGHGTHVASTIAGQSSASGYRIGIAPGVDLYVAKVLGDDGVGSTKQHGVSCGPVGGGG